MTGHHRARRAATPPPPPRRRRARKQFRLDETARAVLGFDITSQSDKYHAARADVTTRNVPAAAEHG